MGAKRIKRGLGVGLSGLVGATIACLSDLVQKHEASAVLAIATVVKTELNVPRFQPLYALILLVALGVAVCFIFHTETTSKAFYAGASIVAIMMLVPSYQQPKSLPTNPAEGHAEPVTQMSRAEPFFSAVPVLAQSVLIPKVKITISLGTSDLKPIAGATVTLRNARTKEIVGRSVFSTKEFAIYLHEGPYTLTVEVPGYRIEERDFMLLATPLSLHILLQGTQAPLFIQRLLPDVFVSRGGAHSTP